MKKLNRKDLPFVMRMPIKVDLNDLVDSVNKISHYSNELRLKYDTESSYEIENGKGSNFVYTAEGYNLYPTKNSPSDYNIASLHSMSEQALEWLKQNGEPEKITSPLLRLKGMRDPFVSKYWDPNFDERVYNKRTPLCDDTINKFLDSFGVPTFRSSITKFAPGMFLSPHVDIGPEYVVRTQTPVITNNLCVMGFRKSPGDEWNIFHLQPGYIYFVNSGWEHFAKNDSALDRFQIRVCVEDQDILNKMETVNVDYISKDWQ